MSTAAMVASLGAVVFLALIHILADRLHPERAIRRRYWLSFADGISISYVFLQLLPEIVEGTRHLESLDGFPRLLQQDPFFPLLAGLVCFYGLERLVEPQAAAPGGTAGRTPGFRVWSHLASYALYKGLIGYLLAPDGGPRSPSWCSASR